ncbi:MAG: ABC transporter permease [Clostridia bacterium]|nr:ABC transporter permease [Clostridia bacterium]
MRSERWKYILSLTVSIALGLLIGALIMAATGHDPLDGYSALLRGAFGSKRSWGNTLYKTFQLCITGLATAVASIAGIFNVGGEGQMYLGAIASSYLGARLAGLSPWIALPVCFLAAILSGALYAWIPAVLKVKLKINEVITTILMNSIAIYLCSYLANGPLKTTERGINSGTDAIGKALRFNRLIPGSNLSETVFYIAAISLLVWYLMSRTTTGYRMRLTGQNERFSRFIGLRADLLGIGGMLISGAMCGALGMFECFALQSRFKTDFSSEFYFDGMLVAMIMRYKPLGIILMSFFFGALKMGATTMQSSTKISSELILIIQSVIIFLMAAEEGFLRRVQEHRVRRQTVQKEG